MFYNKLPILIVHTTGKREVFASSLPHTRYDAMTRKTRRKSASRDTKSQKRRKKRMQHMNIAPSSLPKEWDRSKTLIENYSRLGVVADVNKMDASSTEERIGLLTAGTIYCILLSCV